MQAWVAVRPHLIDPVNRSEMRSGFKCLRVFFNNFLNCEDGLCNNDSDE